MAALNHDQVQADSGRSGSVRVVLAALAGNLAIAFTKFAAFGLTRSTAMLTEAIHSTVDTVDQLLLLIGQKRGARAPDATHPFGYGMEIYFWSFIVALMIFLVGGALSIWEGLDRLLHPAPIAYPWVSLLVLGLSAIFEGLSFRVAYRAFRKTVRGREVRLWRFLQLSKDPSLFATLLEDGAALIGLSIAALGVVGAGWLHLLWADGAASVGVGLLLVSVAVFMANETRSLIAGEAATPFIVDQACAALEGDPRIAKVIDLASLHLGPESILVAVTVKFQDELNAGEVKHAADALIARVRSTDPRICSVLLQLE